MIERGTNVRFRLKRASRQDRVWVASGRQEVSRARPPDVASGVVVREIRPTWARAVQLGGASADGRFAACVDRQSLNAAVCDLSSGEVRLVTNRPVQPEDGTPFRVLEMHRYSIMISGSEAPIANAPVSKEKIW